MLCLLNIMYSFTYCVLTYNTLHTQNCCVHVINSYNEIAVDLCLAPLVHGEP